MTSPEGAYPLNVGMTLGSDVVGSTGMLASVNPAVNLQARLYQRGGEGEDRGGKEKRGEGREDKREERGEGEGERRSREEHSQ